MDSTGEALITEEDNGQIENSPSVTQIQTSFQHTTFITKLSYPTTPTLPTSIISQDVGSALVFTSVAGETTSTQSGEQLDYSKAQLVVAILALCGVGKLVEQLGKLIWRKIASWRSNNAHAAEEMGVFLAGPDPFVEEHPAGAPPGTVPEGDHRDFAAFTQPL